MSTLIETLEKHLEKKQISYNNWVKLLSDYMQLRREECKEMVDILNEKLPGELSEIGHALRWCLIYAMDIIATEDALVKLKGK